MDRVSCMVPFTKVVENGGFWAAARQLNISTSVVTTHVKPLEDRLGVLGRHFAGVAKESGGIEWSFGRRRGLEI